MNEGVVEIDRQLRELYAANLRLRRMGKLVILIFFLLAMVIASVAVVAVTARSQARDASKLADVTVFHRAELRTTCLALNEENAKTKELWEFIINLTAEEQAMESAAERVRQEKQTKEFRAFLDTTYKDVECPALISKASIQ